MTGKLPSASAVAKVGRSQDWRKRGHVVWLGAIPVRIAIPVVSTECEGFRYQDSLQAPCGVSDSAPRHHSYRWKKVGLPCLLPDVAADSDAGPLILSSVPRSGAGPMTVKTDVERQGPGSPRSAAARMADLPRCRCWGHECAGRSLLQNHHRHPTRLSSDTRDSGGGSGIERRRAWPMLWRVSPR